MDDARTKIPDPAITSSTAWRRIAEDLKQQILHGVHAVGAALPTAQDLARHYGVNRHTVRQACKHLEDAGLVTIHQGRGTFVAGVRLPYRLGRRVRFRENLRALDVPASGRVLSTSSSVANAAQARDLQLREGAPLWRIETLNSASGQSMSLGIHWMCRRRFPDFPAVLADHRASFTASFLACGIADYERKSTRIRARMATGPEASALGLGDAAVVLETCAIDCDEHGAPLQIVEAVFAADRVEFILEP